MPEWFPQLSPPMFQRRERRYKFIRVSVEDVLRCLFWRVGDAYLFARSIDGLPDDAEVVSVQAPSVADYPLAFVFLLFHPSFPVIESDGSVPNLGRCAFTKCVRLERRSDVDGCEAYSFPDADAPEVVEGEPRLETRRSKHRACLNQICSLRMRNVSPEVFHCQRCGSLVQDYFESYRMPPAERQALLEEEGFAEPDADAPTVVEGKP